MRQRLRAAAVALYSERGFEQTTAADIAELAGVTERTYFRHFPDKREVLFDGQAALQAVVVDAVLTAEVPEPEAAPLEVLRRAFTSVRATFEADRDAQLARRRVIDSCSELRERSAAKIVQLTQAVSAALVSRGFEAGTAELTAACGMAALSRARTAWLDGAPGDYAGLVSQAFDDLGSIVRAPGPAGPTSSSPG